MELVYSFAVSLFLTIALIPLLIRFSVQLGLVDDPGADRKMHDKVMPRSGGLAIILGAFIPLAFLMSMEGVILFLCAGSAIIVFFGLMDDRAELNYKWKLFGQTLAVILVMAGGIVIEDIPFVEEALPASLSYPLTMVFLLGVINGVNFSDGLDGLAAGTSLLALAAIAILATVIGFQDVALIAMTVIGGTLGFLRYNTFPARIFMGDAGSQFLGFITACLAIVITQSEASALNPFLPVLLLGLPILDVVQVLPVRIKKGLPLPGPDKEHFHHQLIKLDFKHHEVVALIYILQITMMAGAYLFRFASDIEITGFYFVYVIVVLSALYGAHKYGWKMHKIDTEMPRRDRRNVLLRKAGWVYHWSDSIITIALIVFFLAIPVVLFGIDGQFAFTALSLASLMALLHFMPRQNILAARITTYCVSIFSVYLLTVNINDTVAMVYIDGFLIALTIFLMVAIRMSRREQFRLDTQDLLMLLIVIIVPQLPLESLKSLSIGSIALRAAVLMYACEFLIAHGNSTRLRYLTLGATVSLAAVGITHI